MANKFIESLKTIPSITPEEWVKLNPITKWFVITRFAVIIMTFTSAAIAGLLLYKDNLTTPIVGAEFSLWHWLLLAFGLIFAHAANNIINDMTDYVKGVDQANYYRTQYGPQPLQQKLMTFKQLFVYLFFTGLIAVAAGVPLVLLGGEQAFYLMLAGVIFVLFYTYPLKYIGLGEIVVFFIWGPLMIGGGYYVTAQQPLLAIENPLFLDNIKNAILASIPYTLGATSVLFGKHIDKAPQDIAKKIYTLPAILGQLVSRYAVMLMFIFQYLIVFYLIYTGYFSYKMFVIVLSMPYLYKPFKMYLKPRPTREPKDMTPKIWPLWFSAASFYHTRMFGLVFLLGLILEVIFA